MVLDNIIDRVKHNEFTRLFNFKDEKSTGRVLILAHTMLACIATNLTTGVFYTSFLTMNGINIVDAGILAFVPYIAKMFYIFSPYLLQLFPKRRWVLFASRFLYHLLFILGITLLPGIVSDPGIRMKCFVVIVFAANIVNSLGGTGYTEWHAHFIPNEDRAKYFTFNSMVNNFGGSVVAIVSAVIADMLTGSPYEDTVIIALRYIGFAFALLDVVVLLLPKEYPYPKSVDKLRVTDLFVLPFKQKKFLLTMVICFMYNFVVNVPAGVLDYFLINTVNVRYSYVYVMNLLYSVFLFLLFPYWGRQISKKGWVRTFIFSNFMDVPALLLYAFVTKGNYLIVMSIVRIFQHYLGVGRNTVYTNFVYMNLPPEDQTDYLTFYALGVSLFAFLGMSSGTWFVSVMGERSFDLLGFGLTAVPVLLLIQAVMTALLSVITWKMLSRILPDCDKR